MGTQEHVRVLFDKKGVLHIASRMFGREIESTEHVPVILDFRTFRHGKANAGKDIDDFALHDGERVSGTHVDRVRRASIVFLFVAGLAIFEAVFQFVDFGHGIVTQSVEQESELLFCSAGTFLNSLNRAVISPFLLRYLIRKASTSSLF